MATDRNGVEAAVSVLENAEVLIITAGAGIGVDSGLPDFRGDQGFWKAYPMYRHLNLNFMDAANPRHFRGDPDFGWGFYGHRLNLYRETVPHEGFSILKQWIDQFNLSHFVVTSNVDGQFQKAGFDEEKIYEIHGSIHFLQCTTPCSSEIWKNEETIAVDFKTMRAQTAPNCRRCGKTARPNILMFGDYDWIGNRSGRQEDCFQDFLYENEGKRTVIVEIGAGTAVPSIRRLSENLGRQANTTVIRINPGEPHISNSHISMACGGLEGLTVLNQSITEKT